MLPYLWVDSPVGYVLNGFMKFPAPLCAALLPVLFSCAEQVSRIEHVREVPLKTTVVPAEDVGMHRTQATYLLHGAVSQQQRLQRLGQYYFVTWNDANPEQAATLVMMYRQGKTGSTVLTKSISYPAGRKGGTQNSVFEFIGDEAREKGEILAWKLVLKDNRGKTISERHSYLSLEDAFEKKLENQTSGAAVSMNSTVKNDAVMALNALGYSSTESLKAVSKVDITEDMDVEDVLKLALKNMG